MTIRRQRQTKSKKRQLKTTFRRKERTKRKCGRTKCESSIDSGLRKNQSKRWITGNQLRIKEGQTYLRFEK